MFSKKSQNPQNIYPENPLESISENYVVVSALRKSPDIFRRSLIYIILLFIITAFIYMKICKVDIIVTRNSVVTPYTYNIKIYSDQDGYVEKIFVRYGEEVEENSPLFLIRSKETLKYHAKAKELQETIPMREEDYRAKIKSIKEKLVHIETDFISAVHVKKIKVEQNRLTISSLLADQVFLKNENLIMEKEYEDNNVLFTKGLISLSQLNKIESNYKKNKTDLQKIISRLEITEKDAIILEEEIQKVEENYLSEKSVLLDEIKKVKMERDISVKVLKNELEMYKRILSIQTGETNPSNEEMDKEITIKSKKAGTISEYGCHCRNSNR
jgi:multidrug resistance efflux pump